MHCLDKFYPQFFSFFLFELKNDFQGKSLVIPILDKNHFTLAIADFNVKRFLYSDSKGRSDGQPLFASFPEAISESVGSFCILEQPKSQLQVDSSSCGLFVLFYLKQFLDKNNYFGLDIREFIVIIRDLVIKN